MPIVFRLWLHAPFGRNFHRSESPLQVGFALNSVQIDQLWPWFQEVFARDRFVSTAINFIAYNTWHAEKYAWTASIESIVIIHSNIATRRTSTAQTREVDAGSWRPHVLNLICPIRSSSAILRSLEISIRLCMARLCR